MTNEQLLEKLYEGSLTPNERSLLDTRVAESPEFAAEVQEFMTVVQLLDQEKQEDRSDVAFLESTRSKVVTLIAAAGAVGAGGAAVQSSGGGLSFFAGHATQWIIGLLGAAGVGSIVLWNVMSDKPATPSAQRNVPAVSTVEPGAQTQQPASTQPSSEQPAGSIVSTAPHPNEPLAHNGVAPVAPSRTATSESQSNDAGTEGGGEENNPDVKANSPEEQLIFEKELTHYMARLEQAKIQRDIPGQARVLLSIANTEYLMKRYGNALTHAEQSLEMWQQVGNAANKADVYKQIGMINRESGSLSSAVNAFNTGLVLVEDNGYEEIRGLLLGELAKTYEKQGNKKLAFEKLYACVVLLRRTSSSTLQDWENELKSLETSMK